MDDEPSVFTTCPCCMKRRHTWDFPKRKDVWECEFCICAEMDALGLDAYKARRAAGLPRPDCERG